jgi:hypothetical protein
MAVCLIMQFPGVDPGKYEEVMEELGLRGANPDWPRGIITWIYRISVGRGSVLSRGTEAS